MDFCLLFPLHGTAGPDSRLWAWWSRWTMLFLAPEPWLGDDNSWVILGPDSQDLLTQTSQTQTVLKGRGGAREGPGSPSQAPGRTPPCSSSPHRTPGEQRSPVSLAGQPEVRHLPTARARSGPSLLLAACVYNVTRASSSVFWTRSRAPAEAAVRERSRPTRRGGAAAPTPDAGHALLDANTPPFPGAHGDTPRPAAKQQEGRFVRVYTRSWNSRPVATQSTEHNWGRLCNCPRSRGAPGSHHRCP